jgi:hypothetical protein
MGVGQALLLFFLATTLLLVAQYWFTAEGEAPVVSAPAGKVVGARLTSWRTGRDILAYRGEFLRYAADAIINCC